MDMTDRLLRAGIIKDYRYGYEERVYDLNDPKQLAEYCLEDGCTEQQALTNQDNRWFDVMKTHIYKEIEKFKVNLSTNRKAPPK